VKEPISFLPALGKIAMTLREGGEVLLRKDSFEVEPDRKPPPAERPRSTILHVHNVRRCGGTGNFVYDMACCFPEFQHVALCVNDARGDPRWINDVRPAMRTMYAPQLTQAILDEIDPAILILHSTVGNKVEGEHPYGLLSGGGRRYVIALHHTPTRPLFPADLDVFVSEHVRGFYKGILDRMKRQLVMPPCTNLTPYLDIPRPPGSRNWNVTTGGKCTDELLKLIAAKRFPKGFVWRTSTPGRLGAFPGHLANFSFACVWSGLQETWCRTVTEAMAAGCVVIAHDVAAIPEQISHGHNGFLFKDGEALVRLMEEIRDMSENELNRVVANGRDWAERNVGFERMKRALYPYLVQALLGSP
jgi:hypothetical protein